MSIKVQLDTSADPPVTAQPSHEDKGKGKHDLTWKRDKHQHFTFISLTFDTTPNPFTKIKVHEHKVTADDDNSDGKAVGEFPYTIVVSYKGKSYSSAKASPHGVPSDLIIHNRPD